MKGKKMDKLIKKIYTLNCLKNILLKCNGTLIIINVIMIIFDKILLLNIAILMFAFSAYLIISEQFIYYNTVLLKKIIIKKECNEGILKINEFIKKMMEEEK